MEFVPTNDLRFKQRTEASALGLKIKMNVLQQKWIRHVDMNGTVCQEEEWRNIPVVPESETETKE